MATVKGDVHDIGKNIVGVVLACNNYEVIDLGVMVPCEKILQTAREQKVDIIGLSGLITPSLDEMAHVAREMEREGFKLPLLIGGATTSKAHTAVKIAPGYSQPVVHVLDASRAVPVVSSLISAENKPAFAKEIREEYDRIRSQHAGRAVKLVSIEAARANAPKLKLRRFAQAGVYRRAHACHRWQSLRSLVHSALTLSDLVPFIDWSPFFHTWELRGVYPKILQHEKHGEEARKLFADAQKLLEEIGRQEVDSAARRLWIVPGEPRRRRRGTLHRRIARKGPGHIPFPASANCQRRRHAELVSGGFCCAKDIDVTCQRVNVDTITSAHSP